jgi:peptidyl-prolyl cis-trans isomerase B (cyclophilin B)
MTSESQKATDDAQERPETTQVPVDLSSYNLPADPQDLRTYHDEDPEPQLYLSGAGGVTSDPALAVLPASVVVEPATRTPEPREPYKASANTPYGDLGGYYAGLVTAPDQIHSAPQAKPPSGPPDRDQAIIERRAREMKQWQAAYALANPGQPIPTPPLVIGAGWYDASNRTNTMAILALVFGFVFSLLGIIFGHIALGQIRRTGEGGRGLAITGLVFGYVGVGVTVILLVVDLVQLSQLAQISG